VATRGHLVKWLGGAFLTSEGAALSQLEQRRTSKLQAAFQHDWCRRGYPGGRSLSTPRPRARAPGPHGKRTVTGSPLALSVTAPTGTLLLAF
jgi:hypothetical protein